MSFWKPHFKKQNLKLCKPKQVKINNLNDGDDLGAFTHSAFFLEIMTMKILDHYRYLPYRMGNFGQLFNR